MSDDDEYDAYNIVLDTEDIPYLTFLPPSPTEAITGTPTPLDLRQHEHQTPAAYQEPPSGDEFALYDLSEFTADDLAAVDPAASTSTNTSTSVPATAAETVAGSNTRAPSARTPERSDITGGPAIEICMEESTDSSHVVKATSSDTIEHKKAEPRRGLIGPSPFQRFRLRRGIFFVTDLSGPSWCEVQFDYGLRQYRSMKVESRPTSFVTAKGKTISVDKKIAVVNERTTERGKAVHKVLEKEIHPVQVQVTLPGPEERWGLRLINMINSIESLLDVGRCREMPVFGIIHDQVVIGTIDEVERQLVVADKASQPHKAAKRDPPGTPTKPKSKKKRMGPSPSKGQLTDFFPFSPRPQRNIDVSDGDQRMTDSDEGTARPMTPAVRDPSPPPQPDRPPPPSYSLHISDTKTRRAPSLPSEPDILPARLQLMLYHKLLSKMLDLPSSKKDGLPLFQSLWLRLNLDPERLFSKKFMVETGLISATDDYPVARAEHQHGSSQPIMSCLNDLAIALTRAVEVLNTAFVDPSLTVVYRTQPRDKGKSRAPNNVRILSKEEEEDIAIARAVAASLGHTSSEIISSNKEAEDIARAVRASLGDTTSEGDSSKRDEKGTTHAFTTSLGDNPSSFNGYEADFTATIADIMRHAKRSVGYSLGDNPHRDNLASASGGAGQSGIHSHDPELARALRESRLQYIEKYRGKAKGASGSQAQAQKQKSPAPSEEDSDTEKNTSESVIIGKKTFTMDESFLDGYLVNVLDWWHGRRPPKGVDVKMTHRCSSCEYKEGCEWREAKAAEAISKYQKSESSSSGARVHS